jgi:hypothetical protein
MKLTKIDAGWYRYGKWEIQKLHGAWLVQKGSLFPEHSTWASNLNDAKQFISVMEGN